MPTVHSSRFLDKCLPEYNVEKRHLYYMGKKLQNTN